MLSAFIEDEQILNQLTRIIEEENRHVRILQDFLKNKTSIIAKINDHSDIY